MTKIMVSPKTLDLPLVTAGEGHRAPISLQAVVVPVACLQKAHNGSCRQVLASLTTPPDTPRDTPRAAQSPTGRKGGSPQRLLIFNWVMLKRSFISQSRKELLTPPLTHHLRGHRASLRVEIPVFCSRASLRWLTHLRVLLITRAFLWPPPFLLHKGGSIAWLNCWQLAKKKMRVDGTPSCQSLSKMVATDFHHFDFDGKRHKHGGHLKHLASISLSCLHG